MTERRKVSHRDVKAFSLRMISLKSKILKSVKLKQQDVSCKVLVIAIDVKCNFT